VTLPDSQPHHPPRVALVHDYLNQWGGAEQVLASLHAIYPDAPIYTLYTDKLPEDLAYQTNQRQLLQLKPGQFRPSGLQKLPRWLRGKRFLMPFYPTAIERFDLTDYDVVISDSSAYAKGVVTRPGTVHISFCHSPTRYLWDWHERYLQENRISKLGRIFLTPVLSAMRLWDYWAADRVDHFVANSENVRARIGKFYRKPASVIYPPVDVLSHEKEIPSGKITRQVSHAYLAPPDLEKDFYLIVARLSAYKKIELAIKACNRLQLPLVIVGVGREEKRLRELAWGTVRFVSQLSREELDSHYRRAKALIMPGLDDFGMVMVEAMAFGKPVVAYQAGGALEIVQPGVNGEFFAEENTRSLMDTLRHFEQRWAEDHYQPRAVFDSVRKFDESVFQTNMKNLVNQLLTEERAREKRSLTSWTPVAHSA